MKHLGDITKLNGAEVPIVDVICGGSPCQDLSVAGKRAGLAGERSGLFMDQIRIIKEMREHDRAIKGANVDRRSIRPRYMVWENVPGAFSSNKGEDFRAVLEETAKVVCEDAIIPRPTGGKWSPSGCIMGDGWSIAWRVHDAQFWGVPQRRKRIALVADFGGESAPKILFECESLCGDIEESREKGQEAPRTVRGDIEETISFQERAGCDGGARESSYSMSEQEPCQHSIINRCYSIDEKMGQTYIHEEQGNTLGARDYKQPQAVVCGEGGAEPITASKAGFFLNARSNGKADTLVATDYKDPQMICYGVDCYNQTQSREVSKALNTAATDSDHIPCVYGIDRASFNQGQNAQYDFSVTEEQAQTLVAKGPGGINETVGALCARDYKGVGSQYVDEGKCIIQNIGESSRRQ